RLGRRRLGWRERAGAAARFQRDQSRALDERLCLQGQRGRRIAPVSHRDRHARRPLVPAALVVERERGDDRVRARTPRDLGHPRAFWGPPRGRSCPPPFRPTWRAFVHALGGAPPQRERRSWSPPAARSTLLTPSMNENAARPMRISPTIVSPMMYEPIVEKSVR